MLLERERQWEGEGERELTRDLVACSNHFSRARVPAAARGWRGRWDNQRLGFRRASWQVVEAGGHPPPPGRLRRRRPLVLAASLPPLLSLGRDETSASLGDSFHGVLVDDFFRVGLERFGPGKYHTGLNRMEKTGWAGFIPRRG